MDNHFNNILLGIYTPSNINYCDDPLIANLSTIMFLLGYHSPDDENQWFDVKIPIDSISIVSRLRQFGLIPQEVKSENDIITIINNYNNKRICLKLYLTRSGKWRMSFETECPSINNVVENLKRFFGNYYNIFYNYSY